MVDFVLGTQIDKAFIDAATSVVTPAIEPDGHISLNFLGLRDFAILISPVTSNIQILDFKTGLTMTVSNRTLNNPGGGAEQRGQPQSTRSGNEHSLGFYMLLKFLNKIDYIVNNILIHPVTIVALLLLTLCCGVVSFVSRSR